ncbi:LacI family DNA-binding transcriptional regulator [Comamonas odontotermitis]|uniref:LacI family DNA-binding transcriptional regulator n=1 Tax=Comamonas odontotermitis TaxID=379895 RepID=UPI003752191E
MPAKPAPAASQPLSATDKEARRSRASGRITLSDVAAEAGVSPITVSRALRGERRVDAALVDKVRAVAERMGYVPDPAARALASQKSTQVLVLIPLLSNTLFVDLLEAAHKVLFAAGHHMLIGVTHYDSAEEEQLLRAYLPMRPAGLLLTGFDRSPGAGQLLAASAIARVHVMELHDPAPHGIGTNPEVAAALGPVYSVGFSQTDAGAAITRHLLERGYRRIAFCGAQLDARVLQRLAGYRLALQAAGLYDPSLEILNPERSSLALGSQLFEQVVRTQPAVDAIFFCNDDIAQGALLAATRLGLQVPGQIAIAGFNDLPGSDQMVPPLTTIRTPRSTVGEQAATMLLQLMRGQSVPQPRLDLGYTLVQRQSS